jgi:hypothetical protein
MLATTAAAEPISAMGAGMMTCAKYNEFFKTPGLEETIFAGAQGYMSGINDALQDTIAKYRDLNTFAADQQELIIRNFCYKHPTAKYLDAVNELMSNMTIRPSTLPNAPLHPLRK